MGKQTQARIKKGFKNDRQNNDGHNVDIIHPILLHHGDQKHDQDDIEKDKQARARYNKMGATGVPVILYGKKRMSGFSEKGFKRIYK